MLPALNPSRPSLADVLKSCLDSLAGESNRLHLPRATSAVVVLIDGLGVGNLAARTGHARALAAASGSKSWIESGFPTTTASALASFATGVSPGQHGLVGYAVLDSANDRIVNELSGWDERLDPLTWQLAQTIFERAAASSYRPIVIGPGRYKDSGFTKAVLRGARYVARESIAERMIQAAVEAREPGSLIYVYVPELDQAAHAYGWQSGEWTKALEATDASVGALAGSLAAGVGMLVTADHGVVDVSRDSHVLIDDDPRLVKGVRFVAGEPRCLQLYLEPDLSTKARAALVERWRDSESHRAWVVTRDEAIEARWFGEVDARVSARIGDLLIAARKDVAYYDTRSNTSARSMIAQHGSWSQTELRVPLLRFGRFARP